MPYASRVCYDADSHVLEPAGWITRYADPAIRDQLSEGVAFLDSAKAEGIVTRRIEDPEKRAVAEARLLGKGFESYGAWDPAERSRALDLLGFAGQLVFSTFAPHQFLSSTDAEVFWGGVRAHNRAVVDFCSGDERLIPVGYVPLTVPERAIEAAAEAIAMGCGAILVNSAADKERSPTHGDFDPVWAQLEEAGIPFMLHIGTGGRLVPRGFRENGRPVPPDFLGGGENIRSKDHLGIPFWPQYFLQVMALDGVFERFPLLRGGCIEQGAEWIVTMLRQVDHAQGFFKKGEPDLQALPDLASEYIRRAVKFTPFPGEDVGWIIDQVGPELVLFSSDYPHIEGGRDPIDKFELTMADTPEAHKQRFYADNFLEMMGRVPATAG